MSPQTQIRIGMIVGTTGTILAGLLSLSSVHPAVWIGLAFAGGLGFTIGVGLELYHNLDRFHRGRDPVWMTGIRVVFTLLGACFAPWLLVALIAIVRRFL